MARYVLTSDATLDGLQFPRGSVVNAPHNLETVQDNSARLSAVPRARLAGLEYSPLYYVPVPVADQIGRQQTDLALPEENTIKEPVLPTENSQYD